MPASYSKRRHVNDDDAPSSHAGGPLKRTGSQADAWDRHVGGSLDQLPQTQLPQVRTVLRFYRGLRTERPTASKIEMSRLIANELVLLWKKARVPTVPFDDCIKRISAAIDLWGNSSRHPEKRDNADFQGKLNALLDLTPKPSGRGGDAIREEMYLKDLMRKSGKPKKKPLQKKNPEDSDESDWETDFEFFIDQKVKKICVNLNFMLLLKIVQVDEEDY